MFPYNFPDVIFKVVQLSNNSVEYAYVAFPIMYHWFTIFLFNMVAGVTETIFLLYLTMIPCFYG